MILEALQWLTCLGCYDAPAHMTEEMRNASKEAPKAIVMSVYIGALTGFVFLVAVCFCIGDIANTAGTSTGVPLIQIFYDSTNSVVGTCFLASLVAVIALICAVFLMAEGSRSLFAFARDNGLPFSKLFSKVDKKRQVPVYAVLLACAVQVAMNSIYFGTLTGFLTVISIATEGFCKFYLAHMSESVQPLNFASLRFILCDAPSGPYHISFYGTRQSPSRSLYTRKIWHRLECGWISVPPIHVDHLQLSHFEPCRPGEHELYLCRDRDHRSDQHCHMVYHRTKALHRTTN